ncbi:unnamed protein product [Trichobilharzia szidati]|nr:unnamed protein product [Trichobilharzia szidati]
MERRPKNMSGQDESELREKQSLDDFLLISSTPQSNRNQANRKYFNESYTTINITNESSIDRNFSESRSNESNSNVDKLHNIDQLFNRIITPEHRKNAILEICKCINNDNNNVLNVGYFIFKRPSVAAALLSEIFEHYQYDKSVPLSPTSFEIIGSIIVIFQQVIIHGEYRYDLFNSRLLTYLLPYFNVNGQASDVEHLRVSLLGLYATMSSKFTLDDMEDFFSSSYGQHPRDTNNEEGVTNRIDISDRFSLEDLFTHTLNGLSQGTSEVCKHMALILLSRLLGLQQQRARLHTNDSLFNQVVSNLTHITGYISRRITPEVQRESMREIRLLNGSEQTIFIQTKKLLQFVIDCFSQLITDQVLCHKSRGLLPAELRSNHFVELFLQDQDVQAWLETLWRLLR